MRGGDPIAGASFRLVSRAAIDVHVGGKPIDDETKEIVFAILDLLYSALTDEARDNVSDAPWTSPRAKEQDAISLRQWLESVTVPSAFARSSMR